MVRIEMSKEPESRMVLGINLWEVRECKLERAQSGARAQMFAFKFKCGDAELSDRACIDPSANAWFYGRPKLIALGMSPTADVDIDPLDFIGRRVWLATKAKKDISKKTGAPIEYAVIDEAQLEHRGYQLAEKIPAGAAEPVAGNGPSNPDDIF